MEQKHFRNHSLGCPSSETIVSGGATRGTASPPPTTPPSRAPGTERAPRGLSQPLRERALLPAGADSLTSAFNDFSRPLLYCMPTESTFPQQSNRLCCWKPTTQPQPPTQSPHPLTPTHCDPLLPTNQPHFSFPPEDAIQVSGKDEFSQIR